MSDLDTAITLLQEAFFLRQNGEHAPGGNENWHDWEDKAERFLRSLAARTGRGTVKRLSRNGEPSGTWPPIKLGSRWKVAGQVYVLVDFQQGYDGIRLEYQPQGSWEAGRLIDPHAGCWRKPWRRRSYG